MNSDLQVQVEPDKIAENIEFHALRATRSRSYHRVIDMATERAMSYADLRKGRASLRGQTYILTTVTAGRQPFFADLYVARDVVNSFRAHDARGDTRTLAFVIMPDHVHWLIELVGDTSLPAMMKRFKGSSAHRVNALLGRSGAVWQPSFHDHAVRNGECLASAARYIIMNPVRAGLVERIGEYALWDSVWNMSDHAWQ